AATSGVPREEAGLASGLLNTSRQIGASVGLAVLTTLAASRIASIEHGHPASRGLARTAMTAGYARGFQIGALIALGAVALTFIIPAIARASQPAPSGEVAGGLVGKLATASEGAPTGS
ncbi:MAG: MFS transporter, partial [Acidimicrobiales bacterium]